MQIPESTQDAGWLVLRDDESEFSSHDTKEEALEKVQELVDDGYELDDLQIFEGRCLGEMSLKGVVLDNDN